MRTTTADGLDLRRIRTMTAPGVSRRTPSAVAEVREIRTGSGRTGRTRRVGRGGGMVPCPIHDRAPFLESPHCDGSTTMSFSRGARAFVCARPASESHHRTRDEMGLFFPRLDAFSDILP